MGGDFLMVCRGLQSDKSFGALEGLIVYFFKVSALVVLKFFNISSVLRV